MSDHWETFPYTIGERQVFITYDHGIRSDISDLPFANYTRYELTLRDPDERGLPRGDEFGALNRVEDRLVEEIGQARGVTVGRTTTDGRRYVLFYTQLDESIAAEIGRKVAAECNYEISLVYRPDLERSGYWNELFPTEDDWQVIQDMRVEGSLRKEGDSLFESRPITHWAYFQQSEERQRFLDAVASAFEDIDLYETPDCERGIYTARLTHTGLPDHRSMNEITLLLNREAKRVGGDYDGWETEVRRT
jgi:hypothetical protein